MPSANGSGVSFITNLRPRALETNEGCNMVAFVYASMFAAQEARGLTKVTQRTATEIYNTHLTNMGLKPIE